MSKRLKRKYEGITKGFKKIKPVGLFSFATATVLVFFAISSIDINAEPEPTEVRDESVAISTATCKSTTTVKTEKTITSTTSMTLTTTTESTASNTTTNASTEISTSTPTTVLAEIFEDTTMNALTENSPSIMMDAPTEVSTSTTIVTTTEYQTTQDESTEVEWYEEFNDTDVVSIYPVEENTDESESTILGIGQYGYNIDSSEYDVLAQVMAHEGEYCDIAVRERIGICMLNRFCNTEFKSPSTLWEVKNAPYQYFYGYYPYGDETAELAKQMIVAYNSGSEYWAEFCAERNLTSSTVFQRNDYVVTGTSYVYDEIVCTTGGYTAHMYYSS